MMEAKIDIFYNQFHSQTSSKTYPYPKGEHRVEKNQKVWDDFDQFRKI